MKSFAFTLSVLVALFGTIVLKYSLHAAFPHSDLDWYFSIFFAIISTTLIGYGWKINKNREVKIEKKENQHKEKLLYSLAAKREGLMRAADAASVLNLSAAEAETYLLNLAKDPANQIQINISDSGDLVFYFDRIRPRARIQTLNQDEEELELELEKRHLQA